jgi:CRP-like cAMP-binding protein
VIAIVGPDEFFGEGCLTGQVRRLSTASAMTECEIMRIGKPAMLAALLEEPKFSEMFIAHVLARTIRVEADLIDQLFNSSEKRWRVPYCYWRTSETTVSRRRSSPR